VSQRHNAGAALGIAEYIQGFDTPNCAQRRILAGLSW